MDILKLENSDVSKTWIESLQSSMQRPNSCDVTFQCSDGQIYTTKMLLASWSSFWKELLNDDNESTQIILIPDLNMEVLKKQINFLMTGELRGSISDLIQKLEPSLEHLIPDLQLNFGKTFNYIPKKYDENRDRNNTKNDDCKFVVDKVFVCEYCLKYFFRKDKRDDHVKNIHHKTHSYSCNICDSTYTSINGLKSHMKAQHFDNMTRFKCKDCAKSYKNKSDLFKHCRAQNHSYPTLDKIPLPPEAYRYCDCDHFCKICNKYVLNLDKHKKSHHSETSRNFECEKCDFKTNRKDTLYKHERQRHKLHNIKFDCVEKTINTKKKITCFDCGKTFTKIKDAEDHLALSNCKENKCKECGKTFSIHHSLLRHIREVHGGTEFSCPHCNKNYKQKWNRDRHAKNCPRKQKK